MKAFINGKQVHAYPRDRGLKLDQDSFKVQLRKGRKAVLLKLAQVGGSWGFALRFDDLADELKYVLP